MNPPYRASNRKTTGEDAGDGPRLSYLPGLDGLRALAVAAVLLYHAELPWIPGGYLGVEVFFVLSGYLITALLLAEWRQHGRVNLAAFWLRRARRLLPALFLLLFVTVLFSLLFLPDEVAGLRGDVLAAGGYVTNWYLIFAQESYFEFAGRPSLLQHLWSLAIEEQFYLLWPLLFIGWMQLLRTRWKMAAVPLAGAVISAVLMAALYLPDTDPSRIYYGTDTRATGLLVGCALAFAWVPAARQLSRKVARYRGLHLDMAGLIALAALVWLFANLSEAETFLYQGGFAVTALVTAVLIAGVAHPEARLLPGLLGWGLMRWIGQRSYGLYLWHWPVFMVTRPELDVVLDGAPLLVLRLGLTLALTELSYRLVEMPVRGGAVGRNWRALREARGLKRRRMAARYMGFASMSMGLVILLGVAMATARPPATPDYLLVSEASTSGDISEQGEGGGDFDYLAATATLPDETYTPTPIVTPTQGPQSPTPPDATATPNGVEPTAVMPGLTVSPTPTHTATSTPTAKPPTATPSIMPTATITPTPTAEPVYLPLDPPAGHVLAVGDSVMIGASREMKRVISDIEVDAGVSRQAANTITLLKARQQSGRLGDVVVIHIGSNGFITVKQFDQIMAVLKDVRRVVFVNVKVPRRWEGPNNVVIAEGVKKYPNAVLVDWRAASAGHYEYFGKDGIHLQGAGAHRFTQLVDASLGR